MRRRWTTRDVDAAALAALDSVERVHALRQAGLLALLAGGLALVLAPAPRSGGRRG